MSKNPSMAKLGKQPIVQQQKTVVKVMLEEEDDDQDDSCSYHLEQFTNMIKTPSDSYSELEDFNSRQKHIQKRLIKQQIG